MEELQRKMLDAAGEDYLISDENYKGKSEVRAWGKQDLRTTWAPSASRFIGEICLQVCMLKLETHKDASI